MRGCCLRRKANALTVPNLAPYMPHLFELSHVAGLPTVHAGYLSTVRTAVEEAGDKATHGRVLCRSVSGHAADRLSALDELYTAVVTKCFVHSLRHSA